MKKENLKSHLIVIMYYLIHYKEIEYNKYELRQSIVEK